MKGTFSLIPDLNNVPGYFYSTPPIQRTHNSIISIPWDNLDTSKPIPAPSASTAALNLDPFRTLESDNIRTRDRQDKKRKRNDIPVREVEREYSRSGVKVVKLEDTATRRSTLNGTEPNEASSISTSSRAWDRLQVYPSAFSTNHYSSSSTIYKPLSIGTSSKLRSDLPDELVNTSYPESSRPTSRLPRRKHHPTIARAIQTGSIATSSRISEGPKISYSRRLSIDKRSVPPNITGQDRALRNLTSEDYEEYLLAPTIYIDPAFSFSYYFSIVSFMIACSPPHLWSSASPNPNSLSGIFRPATFSRVVYNMLDRVPDMNRVGKMGILNRSELRLPEGGKELSRWSSLRTAMEFVWSREANFENVAWLLFEAPLPVYGIVKQFSDTLRFSEGCSIALRELLQYSKRSSSDESNSHSRLALSLLKKLSRGGKEEMYNFFCDKDGRIKDKPWEKWFEGV